MDDRQKNIQSMIINYCMYMDMAITLISCRCHELVMMIASMAERRSLR